VTTTRPTTRPRTGSGSTAVGSSARFAARARTARWRHRRPLLVVAALVVVLLGIGVTLYAGPVLVVREVQVSGVGDARAVQVRAAVGSPLGRPLARIDTSAMAQRVQALPFSAAVTISRRWPSTVQVRVQTRTPAAVVPGPAGGYRVVDAAGVPFAAARAPIMGLPVIQVGLTPAARPALQAALAVLASLPAPVRATVGAVTAGSPDDVRFTVGTATVVWGSADRSERKAAIYAVLRRTPAKVYDLSSPDTPVLR